MTRASRLAFTSATLLTLLAACATGCHRED
jgi:hypothetical protein